MATQTARDKILRRLGYDGPAGEQETLAGIRLNLELLNINFVF